MDSLIEPLTSRELEVLKLIADGFSNNDIAGPLTLAASTVNLITMLLQSKHVLTAVRTLPPAALILTELGAGQLAVTV